MFNSLRQRWTARRHDKFNLLALMVIGAAVPIFFCWGMPNLFAALDARSAAAQAALEAEQVEGFRTDYASVIALCDQEPTAEPTGAIPADVRVMMIRFEEQDDLQSQLPAAWQPDSAGDVTVVACLGREGVRVVPPYCMEGGAPDFSLTAGYEGAVRDEVLSSPDRYWPKDCFANHPDLTGQAIKRYATDVRLYDARTGALLVAETLWGSDPEICTQPEADGLSIPDYLTGARLEDQVLLDWLAAALDS